MHYRNDTGAPARCQRHRHRIGIDHPQQRRGGAGCHAQALLVLPHGTDAETEPPREPRLTEPDAFP